MGSFDHIDHDKLLTIIGNFPARELIRPWLKAGYREAGVFPDAEAGTPQGGVISPLLANIALLGMEEALGIRYQTCKGHTDILHPQSVGLVRDADDFVICCHSREQAEAVRELLKTWLASRGLTFSDEKTRMVNLQEGFDFLGFNSRRYETVKARSGQRLLLKPSKKAVATIRRKLKETFRGWIGKSANQLIREVNPIILGGANYFRTGVSTRTFNQRDDYLFKLQQRWVRRQHPKKSWKWRRRRYGSREGRG